MARLHFHRIWDLGPPLDNGVGGFGRVFLGTSDRGEIVAIKMIPKAPGAERELLFEDLVEVANIIPILDSGETTESYVLIMPLAEKSLKQVIAAGTPLDLSEVVAVLTDVLTALTQLSGRVVHRDLKPGNILRYDDHWCLADFGIARYADATTDPNTHKYALTPAYAAPEQWRMERATAASDIYGLGCVAFEMLAGHPPFSSTDFRVAHLTAPPPAAPNCPPVLASIIGQCLLKAPEARPTAKILLGRLPAVLTSEGSSRAETELQKANQAASQRKAAQSAAASARRSEAERRQELFQIAGASLQDICTQMHNQITANASEAQVSDEAQIIAQDVLARRRPSTGDAMRRFSLNDAQMLIRNPRPVAEGPLRWSEYEFFDVIAEASINLRIPPDRFGYEGREHSLWYGDPTRSGTYRWYELAFMIHPLRNSQVRQDPFGLSPTDQKAMGALSPGHDMCQLAWPFTPIDQGNEQDFIDRWIDWFAQAALGKLHHPRSMPERTIDSGSWLCRVIRRT